MLKDIFATYKSRVWHDLPISVNDRVISPFCESFSQNKTLDNISEFTVLNGDSKEFDHVDLHQGAEQMDEPFAEQLG